MRRVFVILFVAGAAACRPDPAPLQPDTAAPLAEPATREEPAVARRPMARDAAPSTDALCESFAAAYCEPGDESPAAIRPEMREFVVLDCKKSLLACEQSRADVQHCIESTTACGDMRKCLPKSTDCAAGK